MQKNKYQKKNCVTVPQAWWVHAKIFLDSCFQIGHMMDGVIIDLAIKVIQDSFNLLRNAFLKNMEVYNSCSSVSLNVCSSVKHWNFMYLNLWVFGKVVG